MANKKKASRNRHLPVTSGKRGRGRSGKAQEYEIVTLDQKSPVHTSVLSNMLLGIGFANLSTYMIFLVWNVIAATAQGQRNLWAAYLFAFGQMLENGELTTDLITNHD